MDNDHYTQIIERLTRIETLNTVQNGQILEQTKKTNGRVTVLEGKVDSLEITRAEQKGGHAVMSTQWKFISTLGAALGGLSIITKIFGK